MEKYGEEDSREKKKRKGEYGEWRKKRKKEERKIERSLRLTSKMRIGLVILGSTYKTVGHNP